MTGVALLFGVIVFVMWTYTTDVLKREEALVNELLPSLDVTYELTTATAGLQSQSLLIRSSQDTAELGMRSGQLDATISAIRRLNNQLIEFGADRQLTPETPLEKTLEISIDSSIDQIAQFADDLVLKKQQQLDFQQLNDKEKQAILDKLLDMEKQIRQQVVYLTDRLLGNHGGIDEPPATASADRVTYLTQQLSEYEAVSLAIQDYLFLVLDVVSLQAVIQRVPLLFSIDSVDVALQDRNLLIEAIVSRSIYINDEEAVSKLLSTLRDVRSGLRKEQNLFSLQKSVIELGREQVQLGDKLTGQTDTILVSTTELRDSSSSTVEKLASETLDSFDHYRYFLFIIALAMVTILGIVSYWLVYRKTLLPLSRITAQLDNVGTDSFPVPVPDYYLKEMGALSAATGQLDSAQKAMKVQDGQLKAINQALKQANVELEQFAHIASHDLQEPLRKMQQFSDILEEDYAASLDEDARYYIATIRNAAQRMSILIKSTFEYSRVGAENQLKTAIDLEVLVGQLRDDFDLIAAEANVNIIVNALPVVLANEVAAAQLMRNLISNAIKYRNPDTTAHVVISSDHITTDNQKQITLSVEDNGMGISEKHLTRIFRPFERLHGNQIPGTGLGLAICKKVCDTHGWDLSVRSTVGHGAVFEIVIPIDNVLQR